VRVVVASNRRLSDMVRQGQFRADLFYRLNVLTLNLPPLRERLDDLSALAAHTLGADKALSPAALLRLRQHAWPGNVRELGHLLARARVLADGPVIEPAHLLLDEAEPAPAEVVAGPGSLRQAKQQFEWALIDGLLRSHGGNVTQAAAAAHKDRRAFIALMRKHAIESAAYRSAASNVGV
jgi:two-component system, NtrC family, response regulator GlrR